MHTQGLSRVVGPCLVLAPDDPRALSEIDKTLVPLMTAFITATDAIFGPLSAKQKSGIAASGLDSPDDDGTCTHAKENC